MTNSQTSVFEDPLFNIPLFAETPGDPPPDEPPPDGDPPPDGAPPPAVVN